MPTLTAVAATILVATAMVVAACGGSETEEDRIAAVVNELQDDMAAGRLGDVCTALTARSQRQIGSIGHGRKPTTCPRDLRELVLSTENAARNGKGESLRRTAKPDVLEVEIAQSRDRASVVLGLGSDPFRVRLAKEDGDWKLDDFLGASNPPLEVLR